MRQVLLIIVVLLFVAFLAYAGDDWVNGYYRSDGTYSRGHYRSSPDSYKWNNYGPSRSESDRLKEVEHNGRIVFTKRRGDSTWSF